MPSLIDRPRLVDRLEKRWDHRVVTIVAGPGFGKTTLLQQVLAANAGGRRGVDATHRCASGVTDEEVAAALVDALGAPAGTAIVDAVWSLAPRPVALVVDDAHHLGGDLLATLVESLPANGHLVVASRTAPDIPAARLVARGELLRLQEEDLQLSPDELERFADLRGVDPRVVHGCNGWVALAELRAFAGDELVGDFLDDEVLRPLPQSTRELLVVLDAVRGLDDELASEALGRSVDLAAELAAVPMVATDERGWHTIHALWRPAIARLPQPEGFPATLVRAARVLEARMEIDAAIRVLARAGDAGELRRLIRTVCGPDRLWAGVGSFLRWYDQLPEAVAAGPEGDLLRGVAAKDADPVGAVRSIEAACQVFADRGDVDGALACLAQLGHIAVRERNADDLDAVVARVESVAEVDATSHRPAALLRAMVLSDRDGDDRAVLDALAELDGSGGSTSAMAELLRSQSLHFVGRLAESAEAADRAIATGDRNVALHAFGMRIASTWFQGGVDEVTAIMDEVLPTIDRSGTAYDRAVGGLYVAYHRSWIGDVDRARLAIEYSRQHATARENVADHVLVHVHAAVADAGLAIALGDEEVAAARIAGQLAERPLDDLMVARLHRRVLALSYVLLPETRAAWEADDRVDGAWRVARSVARALTLGREGRLGDAVAALGRPVPSPGFVRAHLPARWAAELGVVLVAAGAADAGRSLVAAVGAPARPAVEVLASRAGPLARTARTLVRELPARPSTRVELDVLGEPRLRRDGADVTDGPWRRARVRDLVSLLVATRGIDRDAALGALWPDLPGDAAANNLRVNLTHLRRALEPAHAARLPSALLDDRDRRIRLVEGEWLSIDATAFEEHLDRAGDAERRGTPADALVELRAAIGRYRGDLFAGSDAPWLDAPREHLRRRYVGAVVRAGDLLVARGDAAEAVAIAERALTVDPWSEALHRLAASAHLALGDRAAARSALRRCHAALRDLGCGPEPGTAALAGALGIRWS